MYHKFFPELTVSGTIQ